MFALHLAATFLWVSLSASWAQSTTSSPPPALFSLKVSTDHLVKNVTQNVSLECVFNKINGPASTALSEIMRIRILKADDNNHWNLVAEIKENEVGIHLYDNILGSGQIGDNVRAPFLKITWPTATASTFGRYRCDILALDNNMDYAIEKSNVIVMAEHNMTVQEVANLVLTEQNRLRHELQSDIKLINDQLRLLNQSSVYTLQFIDDINDRFDDLDNIMDILNQSLRQNAQSVDEKFTDLYQQVSTLNHSVQNMDTDMDTDTYQSWPEGSYSLLEPLSGCPGGADWKKGYHKIHTESGKVQNQNRIPSMSSLPPYTLIREGGNDYVILNFCTKIRSTIGIPWPRGSYCINRRGSCPPGFNSGYIKVDVEDTDYFSSYGGYYPDNQPAGTYYVHYCCRSDGSASDPIDLPTADPFYLYRFNGTCQSVANMRLRAEDIVIDTEDSGNNDAYQNQYHPDGSLNPIKLVFCHYDSF